MVRQTRRPELRIEFAKTDIDLIERLHSSEWLQGRHYTLPVWPLEHPSSSGDPSLIPEWRLDKLRDSRDAIPTTDNEVRYMRNKTVINQIYAELRSKEPERVRPERFRPSEHTFDKAPVAADDEVVIWHSRPVERSSSRPRAAITAPAASSSNNTQHSISNGGESKHATVGQPVKRQKTPPSGPPLSSPVSHPRTAPHAVEHLPRRSLRQLQLHATADSNTIATLQQQHADLLNQLRLHDLAVVQAVENAQLIDRLKLENAAIYRAMEHEISLKQNTVVALRSLQKVTAARHAKALQGTKRQAIPESSMGMGEETSGNDELGTSGYLHHLANQIVMDLDSSALNETIQLCGLAPLQIIATRPDDVLALAHEKLHAFRFAQVPIHWRRLYEDASLHKVVALMGMRAATTKAVVGGGGKRQKVDVGAITEDWLSELIPVLDTSLQLTGAPGRRPVFEAVFQELENVVAMIDVDTYAGIPETYGVRRPSKLETRYPVHRADGAYGFEDFQGWLNDASEPLIIPDAVKEWHAMQSWHDPRYLLRLTLGGRRIVPVEIGKSYTEANWGQRIMPFGEFMRNYLLPENPTEIGYLAQHDLFAQIPALNNDVVTPDYCYSTPPETDGDALKTAGLASVKQVDEPLPNIWLGPKGTKTPLHTDPYHNIFCQVVGYKYVRLYPPSETTNLYPRGVDERGVNEENTSQVDMYHVRNSSLGGTVDMDALEEMERKFPRFKDAKYQEAVLGPGECLYVPLGWWHYVEGLTTSISVSYWWN